VDLKALLTKRALLAEQRDAHPRRRRARGDTNLTPDEDTAYRAVLADLDPLDARIADLAAQEERNQAAARPSASSAAPLAASRSPASSSPTSGVATAHAPYFRDLGLAYVGGDPDARGPPAASRRRDEGRDPRARGGVRAAFERALDDLAIGDRVRPSPVTSPGWTTPAASSSRRSG